MKLIDSSAEVLLQAPGIEGVYKQIELAGRTCYKSEDKIIEDSAKGFVDRMIASHHTAMLEHGTVYLAIPISEWRSYEDYSYSYLFNPYSKVNDSLVDWENWEGIVYITTNYRVLVENNWLDDLQYVCSPTEFHEKRYTFKFITDRGVSHELVRHRVFSFAQESTRYCNYSKDKFGNEITFIKPSWKYNQGIDSSLAITDGDIFEGSLKGAEYSYFELLEKGWTPQQARQVLPNALKTEVIMTGFAFDWRHFFDLRMWGKTGAPHPDMKELATKAMLVAQDAGIWMSLEKQPSQFEK